MGTRKDKNIHDKVKEVIDTLVEQGCDDREFTTGELKKLIRDRTDIRADSSIIPSDYCFNRVNQGITFEDRPRLLEYVKRGVYKCVDKQYPYSGIVKARPKGFKEDMIVGEWKNGEFFPNENWKKYYT